jgi:hypothetical protein
MRTSRRRPTAPHGELPQPTPRHGAGWLLTAVSVAIGIALIFGTRGLFRQLGIPLLVWIPIYVVFMTAAGFGVERGRRMRARSAADTLAKDSRPPVLYLRSFKEDGRDFSGHHFLYRSYEESVVRSLRHIGPVIAVGSPEESAHLPALGAARMYLRDAEWRAHVDALIRWSGLIVVHAGTSPGLIWELHRVLMAGRHDRLIICLPVDRAGRSRRSRRADQLYQNFREATQRLFPKPLPQSATGYAFLFFWPDWTPILLDARNPPSGPLVQGIALGGLSKEFKRLTSGKGRRSNARQMAWTTANVSPRLWG